MPFPPKGLKSQENPLKHRFTYSFGLSAVSSAKNSAWMTLVRHDGLATQANAKTILVNPHNTSQDTETGACCTNMSIIQRLRLILTFSKGRLNNPKNSFKVSWTPFFASFENKYDAIDDDTSVTVAAIMQLTKDGTNDDIVPITATKLPDIAGSSLDQPLSTVNLAEAFDTHYNMTTNAEMEGTAFNMEQFQALLSVGTNKGALKACLGRTRHFTLSEHHLEQTYFINKFVPRNIRRVVPFTFFGILIHVPVQIDPESYFQDVGLSADVTHVGVKAMVRYDEWNEQHDNTM